MSKLFPKSLAICLILCLVCALAIGCSVIDPKPTEPTEPAPTEPTPTEPAPTEPAPTECAHVWVDATCTTAKKNCSFAVRTVYFARKSFCTATDFSIQFCKCFH